MKKKIIFATILIAIVAVIGSIAALTFPDWGLGKYSSVQSVPGPGSGSQAPVLSSGGETAEKETKVETQKEETTSAGYSGQVITGSTTPYIRYNEADFEKARSEGKAIYLYFYATWCPICAAERPNIFAAFDELSLEDAVGFEAHFNDGETNEEDQDLAREYGVPYQHTHIFIDKSGNVIQKSFSGTTKDEIKSKLLEATQV